MGNTNIEKSRLKKRTLAILAALVIVGGFTAPVLANNVHFKQNKLPTWTDEGLTLNAAGSLAGLGKDDVLVTLTANGIPTVTCTNPSGVNEPPGRQPGAVAVTGSEAIPAPEKKNGNVDFSVTTNPPSPNPIPGAPDCTNGQGNWTETITNMAFTDAVLQIQQPPGTAVLTDSVTFKPPTSDGVVPTADITSQIS